MKSVVTFGQLVPFFLEQIAITRRIFHSVRYAEFIL